MPRRSNHNQLNGCPLIAAPSLRNVGRTIPWCPSRFSKDHTSQKVAEPFGWVSMLMGELLHYFIIIKIGSSWIVLGSSWTIRSVYEKHTRVTFMHACTYVFAGSVHRKAREQRQWLAFIVPFWGSTSRRFDAPKTFRY